MHDFIALATEHRKRAGWSQARLATEMTRAGIRVHAQTITKLENGVRNLTFDEAVLIANLLGMDMSVFFQVGSAKGSPSVIEFREKLRAARWLLGELLDAPIPAIHPHRGGQHD